MARGETSPIGTERWSPNGYLYRKCEHGWELVHRLVAEEKLGRELSENEYVAFADNDKTNFNPENIIVRIRGRQSLLKRLAHVEVKIQELTALRDELKKKLEVREALVYKE